LMSSPFASFAVGVMRALHKRVSRRLIGERKSSFSRRSGVEVRTTPAVAVG
jgi:hypothetical protein